MSAESPAAQPSRYVIVTQLKLSAPQVVADAVSKLGPAFQIADNAWILASTSSLVTIRNLLIQQVRPGDRLFIVDIAHDKAGWSGYGPSEDARFRQRWTA